MKRKGLSALLCAAVFLLSSCGDRRTVEDMLLAPALTPDQDAVIEVMDEYSTERVVLKYPTSGERRYPIQFIDLDGDSVVEAVVFFAVPSENLYAQMAVLHEDASGNWRIAAVENGKGTDVRAVRVMYFDASLDRMLMVEWFTANRRGEEVSAYRYANNELINNFEDSSTSLQVYDFDGDAYDEFCYVSENAAGNFVLKYVDAGDDEVTVVSTIPLAFGMTACIGITAGRMPDGVNAIFVDENILDEYQATQVFTLSENTLMGVELEDYDILELSRRSLTGLGSQKFFGEESIFIPSAEAPFEDILYTDYTYWYAIEGSQPVYVGATYVDTELRLALCLPDAWLMRVVPSRSENEQRVITVYDAQLSINVLYVRVLTVGENAQGYTAAGYELVAQTGAFRYYVRCDGSEEDFLFIKDTFTTM